MSTTITIPTELEKKIAALAAAEGKNVEEYALEALTRATDVPTLRNLFADIREQIQSQGLTDEELNTKVESAVKDVRNLRRA